MFKINPAVTINMGEPMQDTNGREIIEDGTPLGLARYVLSKRFERNNLRTLIRFNEEFFQWHSDRNTFDMLSSEGLRAIIYACVENVSVIDGHQVKPFVPTQRNVSGIIDAMTALVRADIADFPAWMFEHPIDPANILPFKNGLLDVGAYARTGEIKLLDPTPAFVTRNALPFDFNADATCGGWIEFLSRTLDDDAERGLLLQEWFGLNLIPCTKFQKAMLLIGPPRGGKGTILRMLQEVVGIGNVAMINLFALADRFGLAGLIGKLSAVASDVHLGRSTDSVTVTERLKGIIGEDSQCIERKYLSPLMNVRLLARFTLAANEFPRLPDSSAAMRSRLLPLPLFNTWEGREDFSLFEKLQPEAPGVAIWALDGLRRLQDRQTFTLPAQSKDLLRQFARLSAPIQGFVEDRLDTTDPDAWESTETIWTAWKGWATDNGHETGSKARFGEHLRAAVPSVRRARKREDDDRVPVYFGIKLTLCP